MRISDWSSDVCSSDLSVIQQYADAWARNDRALLISLFANNAKWIDPVGTPAFTGHAGVAAFWDFAHQDASRELTPKVHRIVACGNEGILDLTMQVRAPSTNQGLDLHEIGRASCRERVCQYV